MLTYHERFEGEVSVVEVGVRQEAADTHADSATHERKEETPPPPDPVYHKVGGHVDKDLHNSWSRVLILLLLLQKGRMR